MNSEGFRLYKSKFCSELCNAVRADILALEADHILCIVAENAGRLIFAENNIISVNIYFQCIFLRDIQSAAHLDRQYNTAKLIDLTNDSS